MPEVTIEHILQACEWAKTARDEATPIDGEERRYDQSEWDCGTTCCIWGAANLIAGNGPASGPPPPEWASIDAKHRLLNALMRVSTTTPDMVEAVASNANLTGADLRNADLRGANLRGADLLGHRVSGGTRAGRGIRQRG